MVHYTDTQAFQHQLIYSDTVTPCMVLYSCWSVFLHFSHVAISMQNGIHKKYNHHIFNAKTGLMIDIAILNDSIAVEISLAL